MDIRRKVCSSVCRKIKEIHGLQPTDILSTYLNNTVSFVDMSRVLSKMEIPCIKTDFSELQKNLNLSAGDAIWGMAATRGDDLIIAYSKNLSFSMYNYVLAHELGHCCLHLPISAEFHVELKTGNDVYSDSSLIQNRPSLIRKQRSSQKFFMKESEADYFAMQLLMPNDLIEKYKSCNFQLTTQDLSKYFKVPIPLAQKKIDFIKESVATDKLHE